MVSKVCKKKFYTTFLQNLNSCKKCCKKFETLRSGYTCTRGGSFEPFDLKKKIIYIYIYNIFFTNINYP